jgi:hypothetical protein
MKLLFAPLYRLAAQVLTVELQDIKGVELRRAIFAIANEQLEIRDALVVTGDRLTVDQTGVAVQASHGVGDKPEALRPDAASAVARADDRGAPSGGSHRI